MTWLEILHTQVQAKSQSQVARELGVSRSTVSLCLSGKYGGGTGNIERRVLNIYRHAGLVTCPILGQITPEDCADNHSQAKKIGKSAGNPTTLKLRLACLDCEIRS